MANENADANAYLSRGDRVRICDGLPLQYGGLANRRFPGLDWRT